jgi:hypothetical protein
MYAKKEALDQADLEAKISSNGGFRLNNIGSIFRRTFGNYLPANMA